MSDSDTRQVEPDFVDEEGGEISATMVSQNPVFADTLERVSTRTALVAGADLMAVRELVGEAQRELSAMDESAPRARLHHALGAILAARFSDWDEALIHHQLAHELQPNELGYTRALRHVYRHLQNWTQVERLMDVELAACDEPARRMNLLLEKGTIFADSLANGERALQCFEEAFVIDPSHWPLFSRLRRIYVGRGDHAALLDLAHRAIAATSDHQRRSMLYQLVGELQWKVLEDAPAAMESLGLAHVEDPHNASARISLQRLYALHGRWGDLVDVLKAHGDLVDDVTVRGDRYLRAARICRDKLAQPARAADLLQTALSALGVDSVVLGELTDLLEDAGRHADLIAVHLRSLEVAVGRERGALHCSLGRLYERQGDVDQAVRQLTLALEHGAQGALARLERVLRLAGRWEEWVEAALQLASRYEGAARAARIAAVAGVVDEALSDSTRAIALYRQAVTLDRDYEEARTKLRLLLTRVGDLEGLLQLMESQLNEMDVAEGRASLLFEMGSVAEYGLADMPRAARYYQQASDGVARVSAKRAHRRTLATLRDVTELLDVTDSAREEGGQGEAEARALARAAAALLAGPLERGAEAELRYGRVLERDPTDEVAALALAALLEERSGWPQLVDELQRRLTFIEGGAARAALHGRLGELCWRELKRPELALAHYGDALELEPQREDLFSSMLTLCRREEKWEELASIVSQRIEVVSGAPRRARLLQLLGELYSEKLDDHDRAIDVLNRAVEANSKCVSAQELLLELLEARCEHATMLEVLERGVQHAHSPSNQRDLLKRLARLRAQLGMHEIATTNYEAALDLDPGDFESIDALILLYAEAKEHEALVDTWRQMASFSRDAVDRARIFDEAARWSEAYLALETDVEGIYRQALESNPDDQAALSALERLAAERDDPGLTEDVSERLFQRATEPIHRAELGLRLEAAQEGVGDFAAAAATLEDIARGDQQWLILHALRRIYEAQGDWASVARTLEREARASVDLSRARVALHAAAELAYEQLGAPEHALELLRQILREDPHHGEAAHLLEQILVQRGDWEALVSALQERVSVSRGNEGQGGGGGVQAQVTLMARVAWIQREHLARPDEAIATLRQVLEVEPHHPPTLQTLAELCCTAGQWREAVDVYSTLVGLSDDPDLLLRTHVALGRIFQDKLGESKRAISSYQNVLAIEPQQRSALSRLAELFMQQQEWESAAEMVQRLLDTDQELAERVDHFVALAEIYERGYRDLEAAASRYGSALELDPANADVVDRLVSLLSRLGQWERACEATRAYLASLPEERQREGLSRRLVLGKILHGTLRRPKEALEQYRAASEIDPTHVESRLRVGELLAEQGRHDDAVAQLRDILELDPLNAEALQALSGLWALIGADEQAYAAAAALVTTGAAREQDQRIFREGRVDGVRVPSAPLDPSLFASTLVHPGQHHTGRAVLLALADVAPKIFPADLSAWQVGKADRLSGRGDDPVVLTLRQVRELLGVEQDIDVYVSHTRSREMGLLRTDPPSLVVGGGVMSSFSSREVRFHFAKLLCYVRIGTIAAYGLDARGLKTMVAAARRVVDPACELPRGVEPAEVMLQAEAIERALSRRGRRQLEEATLAFTESRLPSYTEWQVSLDLTALRVALWLVNDIDTALRHVRASSPELAQAKSTEAFVRAAKHNRAVAELMRFWLSEDYLRAKRSS